MITCPKCGHQQTEGAECLGCGIVFAKWAAIQRRQADQALASLATAAGAAPAKKRPAAPPNAAHSLAPEPTGASPQSPGRFRKDRAPRALRDRWALPVARVGVRDVCTGLGRLLEAGTAPQAALTTLAGSARPAIRAELSLIGARLQRGDTLADACQAAPRLFRSADIEIVRAFSEVGRPGQGLLAVAEQAEEALAIRRLLFRSAAYPIFVLLSHIVISPVPNLIFGSLSSYLKGVLFNAATLGLGIIAVLFGLPALLRATPLGDRLKRLAWRLPWPGSIYRSHVRALFTGTLARNLGAGLELYKSTRSAAAATSDPVATTRVEAVLPKIGQEGLTQPLSDAGLIAAGDAVLVISGEGSGTLAEALSTVSARYAAARQRGLKLLMALAGGVLTLIVVIIVALGLMRAYEGITGITDGIMKDIDLESPIKDLPKSLDGIPGLKGLDLEQLDLNHINLDGVQGLNLKGLDGLGGGR